MSKQIRLRGGSSPDKILKLELNLSLIMLIRIEQSQNLNNEGVNKLQSQERRFRLTERWILNEI